MADEKQTAPTIDQLTVITLIENMTKRIDTQTTKQLEALANAFEVAIEDIVTNAYVAGLKEGWLQREKLEAGDG